MRLLFTSHLYPNTVEPGEAPFHRQLVKALGRQVDVRVMAPVPVRPFKHLPPVLEQLDGIEVRHPRVFYTPGFLIHHHWRMFRHAIEPAFRSLADTWRPDRVLAGFIYPDAAAWVPLCHSMGVPCSVRVNGSDFRLRFHQPAFRDRVLTTLLQADHVFGHGRRLVGEMTAAGVPADRLTAVWNGIDHDRFNPQSRTESRRHLLQNGHPRLADPALRLVLAVGHLDPVKGQDQLLKAWQQVVADRADYDNLLLVLIGVGSKRRDWEALADRYGIRHLVYFAGARPHDEIPQWMNAADCLCLPSRSEGTPNVVLESLACGTPVVATGVGEVPELLKEGITGFVVETGSGDYADPLTRGILTALRHPWDRALISASAAAYTWDRTAREILGL